MTTKNKAGLWSVRKLDRIINFYKDGIFRFDSIISEEDAAKVLLQLNISTDEQSSVLTEIAEVPKEWTFSLQQGFSKETTWYQFTNGKLTLHEGFASIRTEDEAAGICNLLNSLTDKETIRQFREGSLKLNDSYINALEKLQSENKELRNKIKELETHDNEDKPDVRDYDSYQQGG